MPTSPPSLTPLPTPPSTASPTTFAGLADAFIGALPTYQTQENALAANLYANAVEVFNNTTGAATSAATATAQASAASASAIAAATNAGATIWVSGTSYVVGNARFSPINALVYRCINATSGTTDPSQDNVNWAPAIPSNAAGNIFAAQNFGGF